MQELPFLHSARRLMLIDICTKFREDSLRGFQVTERTRLVTDRQTDARGKTMCLPTLKMGDINITNTLLFLLVKIENHAYIYIYVLTTCTKDVLSDF